MIFEKLLEWKVKHKSDGWGRGLKNANVVLYFQSPAHSYSSYDSGKNESVDRGAEDLSLNRGDEDEDDHDEHEDSEKVNETDGVEAERLKAFNVSPPHYVAMFWPLHIHAVACWSMWIF